MEVWMRLGQSLEDVLGDHERILDAWAEGGVRGLVVGRMAFTADAVDGTVADVVPAFQPDPRIYRALEVAPPPSPREPFPERRRQLDRLLNNAKDRGWPILIFEPAAFRGPEGDGNVLLDPVAQRAYLARAQDTLLAFPQVDGAIVDGPEWPYELSPGLGSSAYAIRHGGQRHYMFADLPAGADSRAADLGYDATSLAETQRRLVARLHALTERDVAAHASGGLVGALALLGFDPGIADWLRFRADTVTAFVRDLREHLNTLGRPVKLGMGPRTASFAPLAGYDLGRLGAILDYVLPKHYFWHRGFDGMYGTLARYVETLVEWNPGLSEPSAFAVVRALLGINLPGIDTLSALEDGFPPAFFGEYVADQTRRAITAVGDAARVVPWVDVGRLPHDGDPIGSGDLRRILEASASVGLTRFLYHNHAHLSRAEWRVISELCGHPWTGPGDGGYCPPDGFHLNPRSA